MMRLSGIPTYIAILLLILKRCSAVTEDDIKECGTSIFSSITCSSVNLFYRECPVTGATEVNKIKLSRNLSQEVCEFDETFGFRSNVVWVKNGCSGEFYVCYNGVRRSSTGTPRRTTTVEISRESVENISTDNVTLYIVIAVIVAILVLAGLILGCLLKRRQSAEKSKRLAEKRRMNLEARDSRKIDEDVQITPMRSQASLESVCFPEGTVDLDKYEKGSVCSSRSSTSGLGSIISKANRTTSKYVTSGRPVSGGLSLVLDPRDVKRSGSVPDVRSTPIDQGLKSYSGYKGSQTSLESIKELTACYNSGPQNGGRRKRYSRPAKYNTVGVHGSCADNLYNPNRAGLTLPTKRARTRAYVHAERGSLDSGILSNVESDVSVSVGSHYEDPQLVLPSTSVYKENISDNDSVAESRIGFRPISPPVSNPESLYSTVKKPRKPIVPPKPTKDVYTTDSKFCLKVPPTFVSPPPPLHPSTSLEEINHDEAEYAQPDNDINAKAFPNGKTQNPHYAFMSTFKPTRDYEEVDFSADYGSLQVSSSNKARF